MERKHYIIVPKSKIAMEHWDYGIETEDEVEILKLSLNEYEELDKIGLFDRINDVCDIMIDDYESEVLELYRIPDAIRIVKEFMKQYNNKKLADIKEVLVHAYLYKRVVEFAFDYYA